MTPVLNHYVGIETDTNMVLNMTRSKLCLVSNISGLQINCIRSYHWYVSGCGVPDTLQQKAAVCPSLLTLLSGLPNK